MTEITIRKIEQKDLEFIYKSICNLQNEVFDKNKFDAVMAVNELYAVNVLKTALRRGFKIPEDLHLIAFTDGVISQYNNQYLNALVHYNHALQQRNALLKDENATDNSLFEIWEEQMGMHGKYIHAERKQFIERFIPLFQGIYSFISEDNERVGLEYISQLHEADLTQKLASNRERDRIIGFSMNGIHKDELEMTLAGHPMKRVGSQGQNKTYLVSLKLAQFNFLKQTHGVTPILLLDDIFDKLDEKRVTKIVELVSDNDFGQIFISDTNSRHWEEILPKINQSSMIFNVVNGEISEAKSIQSDE